MNYREIIPTGFLGHFIHCFWEYKNADSEREFTILPDGFFDLIAEINSDKLVSIKLTGVWTKPVHVTIPPSAKIFAIRFKLLATEYLFHEEIKSILDTSKPLPLYFWGINEIIHADFEYFVQHITTKLNYALKHLNEIDSRKLKLFELIYHDKPNSVAEISKSVLWSSRQINRYFNKQFGFPLKEFLNIIRCKSSYKNISNGLLYPEDHFFDQAHFIKDVKKYTGSTPGELHKNKNDRFLQLSRPDND